MNEIPARNVVNIINKTLNLVDPRLIDHGGRVADFVCRAIRRRGGYSRRREQDICLLAMLHDIGAYKTEEIDRMVHFETVDVWSHSIYGYLFSKYLSPLSDLAPALFFHHARLSDLAHLHPSYHEIAQMIHIADRMDILAQVGGGLTQESFHRQFDRQCGHKYLPELVELFEDACFSPDAETVSRETVFDGVSFTRNQLHAYLSMVVLSIDFRSSQTVTHTMTATTISRVLGELLGLDAKAMDDIYLGAMLHDLGKQGIPPEILEAPGKLSPKAMAVMRSHVTLTEGILDGLVDRAVVDIAVRHHEKLDGSGYPRGLKAEELSVSERLVTVADILSALLGVRSYKDSFPAEKVLGIIGEVRDQGQIDPDIVRLATENFDRIMDEVEKTSELTVGMYNHLNQEYVEYKKKTDNLHKRAEEWVLEEELSWNDGDDDQTDETLTA